MAQKLPKILLVVEDWISFYNQAEGLSKGLSLLGVPHQTVRIRDVKENPSLYTDSRPDIVVGVGSWLSHEYFITIPKEKGLKVLPWLVSDDKVYDHLEAFNSVKRILTTSSYCHEVFTRDGVKVQVEILPEAVDPEVWYESHESEKKEFTKVMDIQSSFALPPQLNMSRQREQGVPILFTMGGDMTSKGAQEILEALSGLKDLPWIYIMKAWPQLHTFERGLEEFALIKKLGLEERVRYMVVDFSQEFVRNLFSLSDIYVAPSRGEGFGLPFIHAALCGKPAISIDALSLKDVVVQGETGLLAKPVRREGVLQADIGELREFLKQLITDVDLRKTLGEKAKDRALEVYHPKVIAQKLLEHIDSI